MSENVVPVLADGDKTSKNALKKAQKEKEKAERKAAAKKADQEKRAATDASNVEDTAKANYGALPAAAKTPDLIELNGLTEDFLGKEVTIVARVHNSRSQSAKLAFLMLREAGTTIQAVVAAAGESVSKQMVKWSIGVNGNSVVRVSGVVSKPDPPVASASLSSLEIHITKIYMIAEAPEQIPLLVKDAVRRAPTSDEEGQTDAEGLPVVTLKTRLDYRYIDLQTECNQAVFWISHGVRRLFEEYLCQHNFISFQTPCLVGAATEGGGGVFEISNYFGKKAYLAQSPQFYKQMLIAADFERVYEVGPVFRAENSNTHRHLTEVRFRFYFSLLSLTKVVHWP